MRLQYRLSGFADIESKVLTLRQLVSLRRLGRLPRTLLPPERRARRWAQAFQAHDGAQAGAIHREIAVVLFGQDRVAENWPDGDHFRMRIHRLIRAPEKLIGGGYRDRLRGFVEFRIVRDLGLTPSDESEHHQDASVIEGDNSMPQGIDDSLPGLGDGIVFTPFQASIISTFSNFYYNDSINFDNFVNYDWSNSQYPADPTTPGDGRPTLGGWWDQFMDDLEVWGGNTFANGQDLNGDGEVDFRDAAIAMQQAADHAEEELDNGAGMDAYFGQGTAEIVGGVFGSIADFFDSVADSE